MKRNIRQIAVSPETDNYCEHIYALAEDGTLWRLIEPSVAHSADDWKQLPGLPDRESPSESAR